MEIKELLYIVAAYGLALEHDYCPAFEDLPEGFVDDSEYDTCTLKEACGTFEGNRSDEIASILTHTICRES